MLFNFNSLLRRSSGWLRSLQYLRIFFTHSFFIGPKCNPLSASEFILKMYADLNPDNDKINVSLTCTAGKWTFRNPKKDILMIKYDLSNRYGKQPIQCCRYQWYNSAFELEGVQPCVNFDCLNMDSTHYVETHKLIHVAWSPSATSRQLGWTGLFSTTDAWLATLLVFIVPSQIPE